MTDHRRSLDGLRTIAVALVLLMHAGAPGLGVGFVGVDIFFVLSGFLITSLLSAEWQRTGQLNHRAFWARRGLRLLPLYVAYLVGVTVLLLVTASDHWHGDGRWTPGRWLAAQWLYLGNYTPLGGLWDGQVVTRHLWSLAVEAQFYLLWPLLLPALLRLGRRGLALAAVGLFVSLAFNFAGDLPPPRLTLHTRGIALLLGATFALAGALPGPRAAAFRRACAGGSAAAAAIAAMIVLGVAMTWLRPADQPWEGAALHQSLLPAFDLAAAVLVAHLWWQSGSPFARVLSSKPLVYLGERSYGIYLLHLPVHWFVWEVLLADVESWSRPLKFGLRLAAYGAITVALAAVSYRWLEQPFLRRRSRYRAAGPASPRVITATFR